MNWKFLSTIWRPDTFFLNGKDSYLHKIAVPNRFIRYTCTRQLKWFLLDYLQDRSERSHLVLAAADGDRPLPDGPQEVPARYPGQAWSILSGFVILCCCSPVRWKSAVSGSPPGSFSTSGTPPRSAWTRRWSSPNTRCSRHSKLH